MVEALLSVSIPKGFPFWSDLFKKHPGLVMEAINRFPVDSRHIVVEVRLDDEEPRDWSAELRALRYVVSAVRLDRSGRPNLYRVKWKAPRFFVALLEKYDLVGVVPFVLTARNVQIALALSRPRLQQLVRELRERDFNPEVLKVRPLRGRVELGGLTPRQRERFQVAVESGFFDVPRRATLDELARRFSIGKSALSESLALARRKVLVAVGRLMLDEDEAARAALFPTA
jgi:predicted DNA binding protein